MAMAMPKRKTKTKTKTKTNRRWRNVRAFSLGVLGSSSVRLGKKRSRSRPSLKMEKEKCPCLLAWGVGDGSLVCCFNLDEKGKRKRKFCQRCCVELFEGQEEDKGKEKEKEEPGMRVITPAKSRFTPNFGTSVVIGTVVYILGGAFVDPENKKRWLFSPQVLCFNINRPGWGWIEASEMLSPRYNSKAVAVEGKIYVFGGNNTFGKMTKKAEATPGGPWAEVFDPVINKWEPLPPPPESSGVVTSDFWPSPVVVAYGGPLEGKMILFSCCNYIYRVNCKTWEKFRLPSSLPLGSNLTSDGNSTLYWTSYFTFYTYNLMTKVCDSGDIEDYDVKKYRSDRGTPEPTLLHLGGEHFCFLTLKEGLPGGRTKVRCAKFRVSHKGGFQASLVCRQSYIVDLPLDQNYIYGFVL
ncbi:hypothetical protein RHSIM_Rhsim05G0013500 [Rhododendron simsii]|uniref:Galactose oxidase/kelch repeat superfamily protein n=1 Tax=Rhododendron simsii TaxID=118357 RepID=A0A834GYQ2_RHOSS|nr:hypothetical protein RHSIM_Rhsim05G0013500 [Rhododendron simsii]